MSHPPTLSPLARARQALDDYARTRGTPHEMKAFLVMCDAFDAFKREHEPVLLRAEARRRATADALASMRAADNEDGR